MIELLSALTILLAVVITAFLASAALYSLGLPRKGAFLSALGLLAVAAAFRSPAAADIAAVALMLLLSAAFPIAVHSTRDLQISAIAMLAIGLPIAVIFLLSVADIPSTEQPDNALIKIVSFDSQAADGRVVRLRHVVLNASLQTAISFSHAFMAGLALLGGFAIGVFRIHPFEWTRKLFLTCASLVIMFVLGLYLGAAFGNLNLYLLLYQPALYLALCGVFVQIGAGARKRLEERGGPAKALRGGAVMQAGAT